MNKPILLSLTLVLAAVAPARADDLKEFWTKNCTQCHGPDGRGKTPMGKKLRIVDLTDPKIQGKFSDEYMFNTIKAGVKDQRGLVRMKPAPGVDDNQIKALVAYVRTLKAK